MKLRIQQYGDVYVSEIQRRKWYGKLYWTHFITVSGIDSMPWFFTTYEAALESTMTQIRRQIAIETNKKT